MAEAEGRRGGKRKRDTPPLSLNERLEMAGEDTELKLPGHSETDPAASESLELLKGGHFVDLYLKARAAALRSPGSSGRRGIFFPNLLRSTHGLCNTMCGLCSAPARRARATARARAVL